MIMLVMNRTGLKNLYQMVSDSYLKHFHKVPTIPKSSVIQHREGILIGSACCKGELYEAVIKGEDDDKLRQIASFYDYLEIQPVCNNAFLVENGTVRDEETIRAFNRRVAELGKRIGKPVIAASDVHFLDEEDEPIWQRSVESMAYLAGIAEGYGLTIALETSPKAYTCLTDSGKECVLEWNEGNHFKDPDLRTAKAFAWLMNRKSAGV